MSGPKPDEAEPGSGPLAPDTPIDDMLAGVRASISETAVLEPGDLGREAPSDYEVREQSGCLRGIFSLLTFLLAITVFLFIPFDVVGGGCGDRSGGGYVLWGIAVAVPGSVVAILIGKQTKTIEPRSAVESVVVGVAAAGVAIWLLMRLACPV